MFKKTILLALSVLLLASPAIAKKNKTITKTDSTVTDTKYGWNMNYTENWKVKDFKEPSIERLYMIKKNYSVNQNLRTYGGDYTIPTFTILIKEFDGTLEDFEAMLKRNLVEHRSDDKLINKLGLARDAEFIVSGEVMIDSTQARQIYVKRNYKRVLDVRGRIEYINDHEVHEIYLIKVDNLIYVIQGYCEREFFETNSEEFHRMLDSFRL
jgi:hypothetical protein